MNATAIHPLSAAALALGLLLGGALLVAVLDELTRAVTAGVPPAFAPERRLALLLRQATVLTERPDVMLWLLAPAAYAALAAMALAVVPLAEGFAMADVRTGIVVFGAAEALAIVAIFLHGWSSNSALPLIGGFRFVALGLSYELLSMFVLIAAALPAESLSVVAIVEAQADLWNVIRQPVGLPLWLVVTLGVTFWGPLNLADGGDLAGGTSLEASGRQRLLWEVARRAMMAVFCAMGAATFLGGWHGPWLPGWAWMALKTLALIALTTWLGHRLGRSSSERSMTVMWTVLLPISFAGLGIAGVEALW